MRDISDVECDVALEALLNGPGYHVFEKVIDEAHLERLNAVLTRETQDVSPDGVTHFHGSESNQSKLHLQRRVWNMLNLGDDFVQLAEHPAVMKIFSKILGKNFIMGSFAANVLLPGAAGQEPHIDYPYWDLHDPEEFPANINSSFHMNCQTCISMHDFTAENGATAVVPRSQQRGVYPTAGQFHEECVQLTCPAGSIIVFVGMLWHCAMPNNSQAVRSSILGQYLPKFVKPMEALDASVNEEVKRGASPRLRQLLGLDLRYPEKLHEARGAGNTEGRGKEA